MIKRIVSIVLNDKILITGEVSGRSKDETEDRAFEFADRTFGPNENYELFFHDDKRSWILFQNEAKQLK